MLSKQANWARWRCRSDSRDVNWSVTPLLLAFVAPPLLGEPPAHEYMDDSETELQKSARVEDVMPFTWTLFAPMRFSFRRFYVNFILETPS